MLLKKNGEAETERRVDREIARGSRARKRQKKKTTQTNGEQSQQTDGDRLTEKPFDRKTGIDRETDRLCFFTTISFPRTGEMQFFPPHCSEVALSVATQLNSGRRPNADTLNHLQRYAPSVRGTPQNPKALNPNANLMKIIDPCSVFFFFLFELTVSSNDWLTGLKAPTN